MSKNKFFIFLFLIFFTSLIILFFPKKQKIVKEDELIMDAKQIALKNENKDVLSQLKQYVPVKFRGADETDHINKEEKVKVDIIFYGDYDDEFSESHYKNLKTIQTEFPDTRLIFRHFFDKQNKNSFYLAVAAECASKQGKFWELSDEIFRLKNEGFFDLNLLDDSLAGLGIDQSQFDSCLEGDSVRNGISESIKEAEIFNVIGTPTTYINDTILTGATPLDDFVDSAGFERKGLRTVVEDEIN